MTIDFGISSIRERDIDLLLLEEIVASPAFGRWLVTTAIGPEPSDDCVISAQRSVTTSIGESVSASVLEVP